MLIGKGKAWLDDVSFDVVSKKTPLTGKYAKKKLTPLNLDFEIDDDSSQATQKKSKAKLA